MNYCAAHGFMVGRGGGGTGNESGGGGASKSCVRAKKVGAGIAGRIMRRVTKRENSGGPRGGWAGGRQRK